MSLNMPTNVVHDHPWDATQTGEHLGELEIENGVHLTTYKHRNSGKRKTSFNPPPPPPKKKK